MLLTLNAQMWYPRARSSIPLSDPSWEPQQLADEWCVRQSPTRCPPRTPLSGTACCRSDEYPRWCLQDSSSAPVTLQLARDTEAAELAGAFPVAAAWLILVNGLQSCAAPLWQLLPKKDLLKLTSPAPEATLIICYARLQGGQPRSSPHNTCGSSEVYSMPAYQYLCVDVCDPHTEAAGAAEPLAAGHQRSTEM